MRFAYAHDINWMDEERGPRGRGRSMRGGPRHGHGPGGHGFGPGGRGFGPGGPGGRRARRGNVRAAALLLLEEKPMNGYGLMQELETRTDGLWRPSPGAVYPALNQLEDEGLIRTTEVEGKKSYELTDEGRAHVEENREKLGNPWEQVGRDAPEGAGAVMFELRQLAMAAEQVVRGGTAEQIDRAKDVLTDARKAIYSILAS